MMAYTRRINCQSQTDTCRQHMTTKYIENVNELQRQLHSKGKQIMDPEIINKNLVKIQSFDPSRKKKIQRLMASVLTNIVKVNRNTKKLKSNDKQNKCFVDSLQKLILAIMEQLQIEQWESQNHIAEILKRVYELGKNYLIENKQDAFQFFNLFIAQNPNPLVSGTIFERNCSNKVIRPLERSLIKKTTNRMNFINNVQKKINMLKKAERRISLYLKKRGTRTKMTSDLSDQQTNALNKA